MLPLKLDTPTMISYNKNHGSGPRFQPGKHIKNMKKSINQWDNQTLAHHNSSGVELAATPVIRGSALDVLPELDETMDPMNMLF